MKFSRTFSLQKICEETNHANPSVLIEKSNIGNIDRWRSHVGGSPNNTMHKVEWVK